MPGSFFCDPALHPNGPAAPGKWYVQTQGAVGVDRTTLPLSLPTFSCCDNHLLHAVSNVFERIEANPRIDINKVLVTIKAVE